MLGLNGGLIGKPRSVYVNKGIWTPSEQRLSLFDPYWDNVSLLLHMDGSNGSTAFTDSSKNNVSVTVLGDAKISTAQSKYGGSSALFDGTGDSLRPTASNLFEFGTNDFTVECWTRLAASNIAYPIAFGISYASTKVFTIRYGDSGFGYKLQVAVDSSSTLTTYSCNTVQSTYQNQWVHIAFTRRLGVCRLFIDGLLQNLGNGVNPSTYPITSFTDTTDITGATLVNSGDGWNGYIDDLRVTKGVARYTANFTPPSAPFPDA